MKLIFKRLLFFITFSVILFSGINSSVVAQNTDKLEVCIFSKHLQFLDYKTMGEKVAEMGFDGIDLTVRVGGHVEPATVKTDLPKAIAEIEKAGSKVMMIATNIEGVNNVVDVEILKAASACGIKYYRPAWYKFQEGVSMEKSLEEYAKHVKKLSLLNKKLNLVGSYQNHAGTYVGGSYWEVHAILAKADKKYFGTQFDIRHAMVEGANSWLNGFLLNKNDIKTIVLKDYKWEKIDGKWELINVPIGEGMVDFKKLFKLMKQHNINVPISLHCEYDLGGAEKGNRNISIHPQIIYEAMQKDLEKIRELWKNA